MSAMTPVATPLDRAAGAGRPLRLPALATTYEGGDAQFLSKILPCVDYLEVTPDSIAELRGDRPSLHRETIADLQRATDHVQILAHGVGLSIGSYNGCPETYLALLDQMFDALPLAWHSEHLAYTAVDGQNLGTMLTLPKTRQALDLVCQRVERIQERYPAEFLLENVVHLLPDYPGEYSEAGFLNQLCQRTGCGLILDAYNLECDAANHGWAIEPFLQELDLRHVKEIHLAGGVVHKGFRLDVHSRLVADSTIALARSVIERAGAGVRVVTYELLREAVSVLGHDAIVAELRRLSAALCN